jgi:hypothetical protein
VADAPAATEPSGDGFEQPGDEVGPYRLISQIGEGGFGTVWIAERQYPFTQWVALKIVKPGMDSRAVVARFEQERQALAVMDHPHVARVFDGGIASSGRPYFAMELVKGDPVHQYCDERRLTLRARLEVFLQVCDAVHHAHTKGIIHRDLKPANILVAASEGDRPIAKVIDFGIAKALLHAEDDDDLFTKSGQLFGTPAYMSPEQAAPGSAAVDARSDVYALGVILYELLTGVLPCLPAQAAARTYGELQKVVCDSEAPAPAARVDRLADEEPHEAERVAARRGLDVAGLADALRGELGWIPMKAVRPERGERYATAAELAADISCYLDGRPVAAAPESLLTRAHKRFRRHRRRVIAAVVVLGVVAASGLAVKWQRSIARSEALRASYAEASLDAVTMFHGEGASAARVDQLRAIRDRLAAAGGAQSEPMALVQYLVARASLSLETGEDGAAAAEASAAIVRDAIERQDPIESLAGRYSTACFLDEVLAVLESCHGKAGRPGRACDAALERMKLGGCTGADRAQLAMNAAKRCLEAGRIDDGLRASEAFIGDGGKPALLLRAHILEAAGRGGEAAELRARAAQ